MQTGHITSRVIAAALAAALGVGGACPASAQTEPAEPVAAPSANTPATWPAPAPVAGGPDGELATSFLSGIGMVLATRQVMAKIGRPLEPAPGPNRTVEACRDAAWAEASKLGATTIEAASAGRQGVDRQGRATAPVRMRITYPNLMGFEVREAVMICTIDRRGTILEVRS
ncbi:hypothetical protein [uncultured Enterovirga sp.]|uniref:hypothetical protein n=1 Tax=uncultured Enterovirga sp. TaxID=2026352 RepID=UPI0035CB5131